MNIVLRSEGYGKDIPEEEFTLENFQIVLNFMKQSELPMVAIIGNKPTTHSRFFEFVEMCVNQNIYLRISLEDVPDDDIIERLAQVATAQNVNNQEKVGFLLDLTTEDNLSNYAIKKLGRWSVGSVTLNPEPLDLVKVCKAMVEHQMVGVLRISFALPFFRQKYEVLPIVEYKEKIKEVVKATDYRRQHEIRLILDCGAPACLFDKEDVGDLYMSPLMGLDFVCAPKPEILPNLKVAHCSMLASETLVDLMDFNSFSDLAQYLSVYFKNYDSVFDKCTDCIFRDKMCGGGCKGYNLNKNKED